jgi:predicted 2-oxoglutarate/Fe(II)-dependent dioxygenase YbiX
VAIALIVGFWLYVNGGLQSTQGGIAEERFAHRMSASDPPYATFEKLFTDEECEAIIKFGLKQQLQDATISTGREKSDDTRRGQVGPFRQVEEMAWVYERVLDAMGRANSHSWKYNLPVGAPEVEMMQFGLYDHSKKAFYKFHADNGFFGSPHENRKLSLTVQLSDNSSYTGGALLIRPSCVQVPGEDLPEPTTASSARGAAIVFPSCLSHMVTPVETGRRYSLVQWVQTSDAAPDSDNMAQSYLRDARKAMDLFQEKAGKKAKMTNDLFAIVNDLYNKYKRVKEIWPTKLIVSEVIDAFKVVHKITSGDSRVVEMLNDFSKPLPARPSVLSESDMAEL